MKPQALWKRNSCCQNLHLQNLNALCISTAAAPMHGWPNVAFLVSTFLVTGWMNWSSSKQRPWMMLDENPNFWQCCKSQLACSITAMISWLYFKLATTLSGKHEYDQRIDDLSLIVKALANISKRSLTTNNSISSTTNSWKRARQLDNERGAVTLACNLCVLSLPTTKG